MWEWQYYLDQKGDPRTNNLGHTLTQRNGQWFVAVPGPPIWKVKGEHEQNVSKKRKLESSEDNPFGTEAMDETFNMLGQSLMDTIPKATGKALSLAEVMGFDKHAVPPPTLPEAPPKNGTGDGNRATSSGQDSACSNFFSFGFKSMPAPADPIPSGPPNDTNPDATSRKGRGRGGKQKPGARTLAHPGSGGRHEEDGAQPKPGNRNANPKGGRPRSDLVKVCNKLVEDFAAATGEEPEMFGEGFKHFHRNTTRSLKMIKDRMAEDDCNVSENMELAEAHKKATAVMTILTHIEKNGIAGDGLAKVIDEQMHFLTLGGEATTLELPTTIRLHRFDSIVRSSTAAQFWRHLEEPEMLASGIDRDNLDKKRRQLIVERVVALSKAATQNEAGHKLRNQFPDLGDAAGTPTLLPTTAAKELHDDLKHLICLLNREKRVSKVQTFDDLDVLEKTLGNALTAASPKSQTCPIVSSLETFPHGRSEIAATKTLRAKLDKTRTRSIAILNTLQTLTQIAKKVATQIEAAKQSGDLSDLLELLDVAAGLFLQMPLAEETHVDRSIIITLFKHKLQQSMRWFLQTYLQLWNQCFGLLVTNEMPLKEWCDTTVAERMSDTFTKFEPAQDAFKTEFASDEITNLLEITNLATTHMSALVIAPKVISTGEDMLTAEDAACWVANLETTLASHPDSELLKKYNFVARAPAYFRTFLSTHCQEIQKAASAKHVAKAEELLKDSLKLLSDNLGDDKWVVEKIWGATAEKQADSQVLASWRDWEWPDALYNPILSFAAEVGDTQFQNQVTFLVAMQGTLVAAAKCVDILLKSVDPESRLLTQDSGTATGARLRFGAPGRPLCTRCAWARPV